MMDLVCIHAIMLCFRIRKSGVLSRTPVIWIPHICTPAAYRRETPQLSFPGLVLRSQLTAAGVLTLDETVDAYNPKCEDLGDKERLPVAKGGEATRCAILA